MRECERGKEEGERRRMLGVGGKRDEREGRKEKRKGRERGCWE